MDFSDLVLAPCMDAFGIAITVTPTVSQPSAAAYAALGIWTVRDVDIVLEDGAVLASKSEELGIRLADYAMPPIKGDTVAVNGNSYLVDQVRPDGQGGARLILKAQAYNTD